MYFNAGLIPVYLNFRNLGLTNTFWIYIIGFVGAFNIILCKTFIESLPRFSRGIGPDRRRQISFDFLPDHPAAFTADHRNDLRIYRRRPLEFLYGYGSIHPQSQFVHLAIHAFQVLEHGNSFGAGDVDSGRRRNGRRRPDANCNRGIVENDDRHDDLPTGFMCVSIFPKVFCQGHDDRRHQGIAGQMCLTGYKMR